mgnify:CR=1 FL=1
MKFDTCTFNAEYPVYGARFLENDVLLIAGGGGEGKNGIPNMLSVLKVKAPANRDISLDKVNEYELEAQDDSPTALDATGGTVLVGCNENSAKIESGEGNKHIRKFTYDPTTQKYDLTFAEGIDFDKSKDPNEYTKVINISHDGSLAAIASSTEPTTLRIINPADMSEEYEIESALEIKDLQFSPNGKIISYITKNSLELISTVTGKSLSRILDFNPNWNLSKIRFINDGCIVISAGLIKGSGIVLITVDFKSGKCTICKSKLVTKKFKGITSMDVDAKGELAAISTNDNSVILVKLNNLQMGKVFNQIHGFAITKIAISPNSKYVASVSAANTVHVISVPEGYALSLSVSEVLYKIFTRFVLVVIIGLLLQHIVENDLHTRFTKYVLDLKDRRNRTNGTNDDYFAQTTLVGNYTNTETIQGSVQN